MKKFYLAFFLLGAITALPYVFPVLWFIPWISLIPFAYILIKYGTGFKKRKAYLLGLSFGMGYFGLTYHWFMSFYGMEFLGLEKTESILLVATCWIGLSLLQALEFGMFPVLYRIANPSKQRPWLSAILIPALWMIYEWQQTLFWRGVPWARLALTQSSFGLLWQSASLLGSIFVSGIIVAFASLIAAAIYAYKEHRKTLTESEEKKISLPKKSSVLCIIAAGIFVLNLLFGAVKTAIPIKAEGETYGAAVIQGNISSADKWNTSAWTACELYVELTRKCVLEAKEKGDGISLVVWPETVMKDGIYGSYGMRTYISGTAKELGVTIIAGGFDFEKTETGRNNYNAMFAFYPDGRIDDTKYYKQRLVPFGEFTPMESVITALLPILTELNILNAEPYTPGIDSTVFKGTDGSVQNIGSLICFDSIYEALTVDSVRNGAEVITLSTNDSWFSDSAAVYQHNRHACLRAIESGRYIVRAANTGVSSVISPNGEIMTDVPPLVEGYSYAEISSVSARTLYSYTGNLIVYLSIAFLTGMTVFGRYKKHLDKKNKTEISKVSEI